MKPLLISSGEPAGIGPDLCLALAGHPVPLVVLGDKAMLAARARQLNCPIVLNDYQSGVMPQSAPHHLTVLSFPCAVEPIPGMLNALNTNYVLNLLAVATDRCMQGEFSALVTAPVNKAVLNQDGFDFSGHTEFLANRCQVERVVMLLACQEMKVALMTTHLPLRAVADAITYPLVVNMIRQLHTALQQDFGLNQPKIYVAGLNPHAGESGYLGLEEIEVIIPALTQLQEEGIDVKGPFPADTMFSPHNVAACDVFVAMYHDQGLPVLKYASFGRAVNITLGLPIIRTSVDHGTALELAGKGLADSGSLFAAVDMAANMVVMRRKGVDPYVAN